MLHVRGHPGPGAAVSTGAADEELLIYTNVVAVPPDEVVYALIRVPLELLCIIIALCF